MATLSQETKDGYLKRYAALKAERVTWIDHWRELSDYIQPRRGRFTTTDRNQGTKKNTNIINGIATWAARILSSGMMAGVTSPARSWFRLSVPSPQLNEEGAVRNWLYIVEDRIREAFAKSNLYTALHILYSDMAIYGTGAMLVEEDEEDTVRAYVFPVGQYCLANSARLQVDTLYREFSMTAAQLVERFGEENCSPNVVSNFKNKNYDSWHTVLHIVEPNRDFSEGAIGVEGKPWISIWIESSSDAGRQGALAVSGYNAFPVMAPRWSLTAEDIYGGSPAMEALGDIRALQLLEKRKAQMADKLVNPPMKAPTSLLSQRASLLPGDITYVDAIGQGQSFTPAMEVNPNGMAVVMSAIKEHEDRIRSAFYADLWLMLASKPETMMTAREVVERHEEKALQLGPVLERLSDELLNPLIERVFSILLEAGRIPPAPEELAGQELKVEYVSVMAQAQKAVGANPIERVAVFAGQLAGMRPDVVDKLELDQCIDEYARLLGAPPTIVRSDDLVNEIRQRRAQMQQQQAQIAQAQEASRAVRQLSQADLSKDSALKRIVEGTSPLALAGE